ncbi:MAG: DUF2752 domain-containing protein [Lachnospiraceae bacterium]|nr:DUF2752 domain-containing protein [Lachnospiraceae bacterium]
MEEERISAERTIRRRYVRRTVAEILAIGAAYYLFISITHLGIPCPVKLLTGYSCPGCGISHLFLSLAKFDLAGAFSANPFVFVLLPFALLYAFYRAHVYVKNGVTEFSIAETAVFTILLIAAVLFAVLRNLNG